MAYGFDIDVAMKATLIKLLQRKVLLILCTDSKSLYNCPLKLETTQEKQLIIDVINL